MQIYIKYHKIQKKQNFSISKRKFDFFFSTFVVNIDFLTTDS